MKIKFPIHCPSCESSLVVTQLSCSQCETKVSGNYFLPTFLQMTAEEQVFILQFLLTSGSLKQMASEMGNSYPTVRNKLDDIIQKIKTLQDDSKSQ